MFIGACTLRIQLFETHSLKEKRQILRSIIERCKNRFNISVAEVGLFDSWQVSEIGFACVSSEKLHADKVIRNVIRFIDGDGRVEITSHDVEIL